MLAHARRIVARLRHALGSQRAAEEELAREMAAHLAVLADEFRRRGMTPDEARSAARRAMGGVEQAKELQRDARSFAWIAHARRDVRFAWRTLVRNRGVSVLVILTLGLGIGATTAVYSTFDAAFLRPLPFPEPDRLVRLSGVGIPLDRRGLVDPTGTPASAARAVLYLEDLDELRSVFSHAAAHATGTANLGTGPQPRRVDVTFVTAGFFATLERRPALGRVFAPEEMLANAPKVTMLSDRLWRTQFGGDPAIVGMAVSLDGVQHQVVGVMPADFRFPARAELWVPLPVPAPLAVLSAFRNFLPAVIVARLAPGVGVEAAARQLDAARGRLLAPAVYADSTIGAADLVVPLQRSLAGDRRSALFVVMASAGLLLLIACVNAATLLLSHAATRRREIATHAVIGATRGRILVRLLIESVMLAAGGAVLGVAIAANSLSALATLMPPGLDGLAPAQLDRRVLLFAIAVTMLTGVIFGWWPAIGASRLRLSDALHGSGERAFTSSNRLSRVLVVTQVALACVLTVGAVLMLASLRSLLVIDVGMQIQQVASARVNLPETTYKDSPARAAFVRTVLEGLRTSPGVMTAAAINTLPLAREAGILLRVDPEGVGDRATGEPRYSAPYLVVSPEYFRTMGIPLLHGRDLAWTDTADARVAVVNRTLAQQFWPGEDAVGKRFLFMDLRTVIGVVDDARIDDLGTAAGPQVYLPIQDQPQVYVSFVARRAESVDVASMPAAIRNAVRAVDPRLPVYAAQPMDAVIAEALAPRRLNTLLITVFGTAALGLAAIGVYGVLACAVARRAREFGVRMALGAQRRDVLGMVLRQGLLMVACGLAIGLGAAVAMSRYLQSLLYGVTPRDPAAFLTVASILTAVALLAAFVPAMRAAAADPLTVLRSE